MTFTLNHTIVPAADNEKAARFFADIMGLTYSGNVLTGDLGTSFTQGQRVSDLIAERVPATLLLMGTALAVSTIGGIAGALFAVPTVAFLNVFVKTIASGSWRTNPNPSIEDIVR